MRSSFKVAVAALTVATVAGIAYVLYVAYVIVDALGNTLNIVQGVNL